MDFQFFSKWTHWLNRREIAGKESGLYVLTDIRRAERPTIEDRVLYIGACTEDETLSQSLRKFHDSAFLGRTNGSDGKKFNAIYECDIPPIWLYVSVMPINLPPPEQGLFIKLQAATYLWDYFQQHKSIPTLNASQCWRKRG